VGAGACAGSWDSAVVQNAAKDNAIREEESVNLGMENTSTSLDEADWEKFTFF
jgi:hypothetical protein